MVFDAGKDATRVEMIVNAEHKNMFIAHHDEGDAYACIDGCVDKLERQLSEHKKKFRNRKHPEERSNLQAFAASTGRGAGRRGGEPDPLGNRQDSKTMKLREFIVTDAIVAGAEGRPTATGRSASWSRRSPTAGALPADAVDEVVAALIKREQNGSTGFGKGVAVPHVKHAKVKKMAGTIGRSASGDRLRRAGPSAGLQHRAAAQPREPAAAAPAGDEHRLQQPSEGHVPPVPAAERHARGDRRAAGRGGSGEMKEVQVPSACSSQ